MSGHSKWSQIKRQKGAADIKRGQTFTKMANAITIAVREGAGGDPASNFKLKLAIEQARSVNMPKENIKRAIERGLGKGTADAQIESVNYEGYGPAKVALLVQAVTDNRNRTTSEIKGAIEHSGGTFASPGAVSWMFTDEGVVTVLKNGNSMDEIFDLAAEVGAQDVEEAGDVVIIYTKPNEIESIKNALSNKGLVVQGAELAKKPTTTVKIIDFQTAQKVLNLMEKLEELEAVVKVWSNFDIADNLLEKI